jgi:hypothetical protein
LLDEVAMITMRLGVEVSDESVDWMASYWPTAAVGLLCCSTSFVPLQPPYSVTCVRGAHRVSVAHQM